MKWFFEDLVTVPAWWQYLAGLRPDSPGISLFDIRWCFSHRQDAHCRNQGVEMEVAPLTPSDPSTKFLLSVSMTLCSTTCLEVLVPKEGMLLPQDLIMIPELTRSSNCHLDILDTSRFWINSQRRELLCCWDGWTKGNLDCHSIMEAKECLQYRSSSRASLYVTMPYY